MGLFDSLFGGKKSNTTVNPDELAETVSSEWWDAFDDYITDKNDAYFIAFQLFGRSNMIYRRFGDGSAVSEEKYPDTIKKFYLKVCDVDDLGRFKDEYDKPTTSFDMFEIGDLFESVTQAMNDNETKLKVNYAIVEKIIQKWGLV